MYRTFFQRIAGSEESGGACPVNEGRLGLERSGEKFQQG